MELLLHLAFLNRLARVHVFPFHFFFVVFEREREREMQFLIVGINLQVIVINGQFPGPTLNAVTNDNIILNVVNKLDQPFLLTW